MNDAWSFLAAARQSSVGGERLSCSGVFDSGSEQDDDGQKEKLPRNELRRSRKGKGRKGIESTRKKSKAPRVWKERKVEGTFQKSPRTFLKLVLPRRQVGADCNLLPKQIS